MPCQLKVNYFFLTLRNYKNFWKSFINTSCSILTQVKRPESYFKACGTERKVEPNKEERLLGIVYLILAIIYFFSSIKHNFNQSRTHQKEMAVYFNKEVYHLIFFREQLTTHLPNSYGCWRDLDFTNTLGIAALLKHYMWEWGW